MGTLRGYVFESQGHYISLMEIVKANILIDETGHACLADFGLLAITSDATSHGSSSSSPHGGTFRWMSPELFCPGNFGLKDSRRTKHSDCYAFGMVIYEVLSGQVPFHSCGVYDVVTKVNGGERPGRPRGVEGEWFVNGVWGLLERCWTHKPDDRPRIEDVLRCLEDVSGLWAPLSRMVENPPTASSPMWDCSNPDAEGSTEESEGPSLSQSLQTLPPKGDAVNKIPISILPNTFTVPHCWITSNQGLRAYVEHPSELGPQVSVAVLDGVGWA
jgi:hypothetical protein